MRAPSRLAANLTHDCGAKFQIAFEDVERPYTCPGCGQQDQLSPGALSRLMGDFGRALIEMHRQHSVTGDDVYLRLDCRTGAFSNAETADG